MWNESISKLPNHRNKEMAGVLERKCKHLMVWNLTPRNHPDQEFIRCLFLLPATGYEVVLLINWLRFGERRCEILIFFSFKTFIPITERKSLYPFPKCSCICVQLCSKTFLKVYLLYSLCGNVYQLSTYQKIHSSFGV